jgi:ATP/maltotriose-dependent transcriptional regulator MalT
MAAHELLVAEAVRVQAVDPVRAAMMSIDAVGPCFMAGFVDHALATAEWAHGLCQDAGGQWQQLAIVPLGQALLLAGRATTRLSLLLEAEALLDEFDPVSFGRMIRFGTGQAFVWLEDYARARRLLTRGLDEARRLGAIGMIPYPLAVLSELEFRTGHWAAALASASESVRLAEETGQPSVLGFSLACLARIEAAQGQESKCRAHVVRSFEICDAFGVGSLRTYLGSVRGLLELSLGRSETAIGPLEEVARFVAERGLRDPSTVQWGPDLVEAYVHAGRRDEAERTLATFEREAAQTERTWALAASGRCRGLLAEEGRFEREFAGALGWHGRTPTPFERARTELCFGERLRRAGRRVQARAQLRAALATFERLGARPWADRVQSELRASEHVRRRAASAAEELTPQELQVALVVVTGATNRQAAATLFLSPKTIEFHLRNIFRKLDVRSRTELAYRLRENANRSAADF